MILAGIEHAEQNLGVAPDHRQRLQRLRRERRNAEYDDSAWQGRRSPISIQQMLDKAGVDAGTAVTQALDTYVGQHGTPERRLPQLLFGKRAIAFTRQTNAILTGGPVIEPIGTVDLVLVKQVSQTLGQLVAFAAVAVIGEKALQRRECRLRQQLRQQPHQSPEQGLLVQW